MVYEKVKKLIKIKLNNKLTYLKFKIVLFINKN